MSYTEYMIDFLFTIVDRFNNIIAFLGYVLAALAIYKKTFLGLDTLVAQKNTVLKNAFFRLR